MSASEIHVARLLSASAVTALSLAAVENDAIICMVAGGESRGLREMRRSGLIEGALIDREMAKSGPVR